MDYGVQLSQGFIVDMMVEYLETYDLIQIRKVSKTLRKEFSPFLWRMYTRPGTLLKTLTKPELTFRVQATKEKKKLNMVV
eukprot:snap_masked-scaffold_8-processed-gene-1.18-mRNA-1 protein AED:1.00 eAED:1.00 QI:0/0/0/0/1/1/2/0/79